MRQWLRIRVHERKRSKKKMLNRRFNRIPHFDPESRSYGIRKLIGPTPRYKRIWATRPDALDQGQEGACTGFASAGFLSAAPQKWSTDADMAEKIFKGAVQIDKLEGRDFGGEGATVLAAMKACQELSYFDSYAWCFGIDDVCDTLVRRGPVILGINWYDGMESPDERGLLTVSGSVAGGHCILANGFWPGHPDFGDIIVLTNSWGNDWGIRGRCYIRYDDLRDLLRDQGEAVHPHSVRQTWSSVPTDGQSANHTLDS
jgi:hypothetical protein